MGINLQSAHHSEVLGDGTEYEKVLRERLGPAIKLGMPGRLFCLEDEMGWSWWSELQAVARERLGPGACPSIEAVDAWHAVYVDADVGRLVLWPNGRPKGDKARHEMVQVPGGGRMTLWGRLCRFLGLRPKETAIPSEIAKVMTEMVKAFGAREGEVDGLQVGNLRAVVDEAAKLLAAIGCEPNEESVRALRRSYTESNDRVDDDPGVQCLCHLWLTGTHALENGQPMWLLK